MIVHLSLKQAQAGTEVCVPFHPKKIFHGIRYADCHVQYKIDIHLPRETNPAAKSRAEGFTAV